mmetsp:Transcript_28793/g.32938  ORF Transcript_28793/g.32938 Transcript_28793/m.32938 type:complete len:147 (+) Transcript_28793:2711-3151(+)
MADKEIETETAQRDSLREAIPRLSARHRVKIIRELATLKDPAKDIEELVTLAKCYKAIGMIISGCTAGIIGFIYSPLAVKVFREPPTRTGKLLISAWALSLPMVTSMFLSLDGETKLKVDKYYAARVEKIHKFSGDSETSNSEQDS